MEGPKIDKPIVSFDNTIYNLTLLIAQRFPSPIDELIGNFFKHSLPDVLTCVSANCCGD